MPAVFVRPPRRVAPWSSAGYLSACNNSVIFCVVSSPPEAEKNMNEVYFNGLCCNTPQPCTVLVVQLICVPASARPFIPRPVWMPKTLRTNTKRTGPSQEAGEGCPRGSGPKQATSATCSAGKDKSKWEYACISLRQSLQTKSRNVVKGERVQYSTPPGGIIRKDKIKRWIGYLTQLAQRCPHGKTCRRIFFPLPERKSSILLQYGGDRAAS